MLVTTQSNPIQFHSSHRTDTILESEPVKVLEIVAKPMAQNATPKTASLTIEQLPETIVKRSSGVVAYGMQTLSRRLTLELQICLAIALVGSGFALALACLIHQSAIGWAAAGYGVGQLVAFCHTKIALKNHVEINGAKG
jgi:hypothetical protein